MNKRLAAGLLAAASTASVLGVTAASPASAATTVCGAYPPGQAYQLVRVPTSASAHRNAIVYTRGTLRRGGQPCVGLRLGFYVAPAGQDYVLKDGQGTDETGSLHEAVRAGQTFRFFYNLTISPTQRVGSAKSEIIVR